LVKVWLIWKGRINLDVPFLKSMSVEMYVENQIFEQNI
jgi:hypothetical protein